MGNLCSQQPQGPCIQTEYVGTALCSMLYFPSKFCMQGSGSWGEHWFPMFDVIQGRILSHIGLDPLPHPPWRKSLGSCWWVETPYSTTTKLPYSKLSLHREQCACLCTCCGGVIKMCTLNCPGTWHDSHIAEYGVHVQEDGGSMQSTMLRTALSSCSGTKNFQKWQFVCLSLVFCSDFAYNLWYILYSNRQNMCVIFLFYLNRYRAFSRKSNAPST